MQWLSKLCGAHNNVWEAQEPVLSAMNGPMAEFSNRHEPRGSGCWLWCSKWQLHRHGGVTMRHPVNKAAFKAPWSPTRGVGCSTLCLNRVARTHGRFTRRHEPSPGDQGVLRMAVTPPQRCDNASSSRCSGSQSSFGSRPTCGMLKV